MGRDKKIISDEERMKIKLAKFAIAQKDMIESLLLPYEKLIDHEDILKELKSVRERFLLLTVDQKIPTRGRLCKIIDDIIHRKWNGKML